MTRTLALLGLLLLATPAMAQQAPAWMKPGPGQEAVAASCATCHTLDYIRMNSVFLSPDGWKTEVTKMRSAFGAPIDDDTAAQILKYLETNFAAPPKS
jgi:mono/diheme cytochrome c family protein